MARAVARIKATFPPLAVRECGCKLDPDPDTEGLIIETCEQHAWEASAAEYRYRRLMDEEIEQVVKGSGNRMGPLARAAGVVGNFAVAKR